MAEIKDPENTLIMETTTGKVVIQLLPDVAPGHVARIKELVSEQAYDGVVFHRVIADFMAQTGDVKFGKKSSADFNPARAGMGGSEKPDLKAEFSAIPHVRGTCSMGTLAEPEFRQLAVLHLLYGFLLGSTSSTPSGARLSRVWTPSTRSRRASPSRIPIRSCRSVWHLPPDQSEVSRLADGRAG